MTALRAGSPPPPVAGPLFRKAAALDVGGRERRRVLALYAAHVDGGVRRKPRVHELADRLGLAPRKVRGLCDRLEADGYLVRSSRKHRRHYVLGEWAS